MFRRIHLLTVMLALAILLPAVGAEAEESKLIPSLSIKEEYNDNILLGAGSSQSSWITTATPGLALTRRTERIDMGLTALVDIARYHEEPVYNNESQYYTGRLGYTVRPGLNMLAQAGWSRSYSPDRDLEETGMVLTNLRRDKGTLSLSGEWKVSETLSASGAYSFEKDRYNASTVSDIAANQVSFGVSRLLSQAVKGRLFGGFGRVQYDTQDTDNYWGTLGGEYRYHELWTVVGDVGARFSRSNWTDVTLTGAASRVSNDWGGVAKASLKYAGEKTNGSLSFSYDMAPASGRTGAVQRTGLTLNLSRRLTYMVSGALTTGYFRNRATVGQFGGTEEINEEAFRVSPSLSYQMTENMRLELRYDYTKTSYRSVGNSSDRNQISLKLYMQLPFTK